MKNASFVRSSGLWLILGALLTLALGVYAALVQLQRPSPEYTIWVSLATVSRVLILIGTIGLARSGAAGNGWPGKIGLGIALLAGALNIPISAYFLVNHTLADALDGASEAVYALGLTLAGSPC